MRAERGPTSRWSGPAARRAWAITWEEWRLGAVALAASRPDIAKRVRDGELSANAPAMFPTTSRRDAQWGQSLNRGERRTRLALIILELANNSERDLDDIKETALEFMRLKERPARLNGRQT